MTEHTEWTVRESTDVPPSAPLSTPTIAEQLNHRTIRDFTDEPVTEDQITTLFEVARQTATWSFYQQRTIIRITNHRIREALAELSGQPYVRGDKGELFVFVVDLYRNKMIRQERGEDDAWLHSTNAFLTGVYDTALAAQNMVVAAESMGLGTVYLGSLGADPRTVIKLLKLPELTYPIFGLLVGHPHQSPDFKPRLPLAAFTGTDAYPALENYSESLAEYDRAVHTYYDLRNTNRRVDSFTSQIAHNQGTGAADKADLLDILHEQGLALS